MRRVQSHLEKLLTSLGFVVVPGSPIFSPLRPSCTRRKLSTSTCVRTKSVCTQQQPHLGHDDGCAVRIEVGVLIEVKPGLLQEAHNFQRNGGAVDHNTAASDDNNTM